MISVVVSIFAIFAVVATFSQFGFRERRLSRPSSVLAIAALLTLEYVVRPIDVLIRGEIGWDERTTRRLEIAEFSDAVLLALGAILLLSLTAVFSREYIFGSIAKSGRVSVKPSARVERFVRPGVKVLVLLSISIAVFLGLGTSIAATSNVFAGEFGRQNFGSGYAYLAINLLSPIAIGVKAAEMRSRRANSKLANRVLAAGLFAFTSFHVLVTGGRTELIFTFVALSALYFMRNDRRKLRRPVFGLVLIGALAASYRVLTREALFAENASISRWDLLVERWSNPLSLLLSGDVSSFDKLALLSTANFEQQGGATYAAVVTVPLGGEAQDGGNRAFTSIADPFRYESLPTSEGVSYLGEAVLNFGLLGALFAAVLLGLLSSFFDSRANTSPMWLAVWAGWIGSLPTLFRADFLNFTAALMPLIVLSGCVSWWVSRSQALVFEPDVITRRHPARVVGAL